MAFYWRSGDNEPRLEMNQNVFVQIQNGHHVVTAQQTDSTPGILFKEIPVQPKTTYSFNVFGHAMKSESAFLVGYYGNQNERLYKNYKFLPNQPHSTTSLQFETSATTSQITIGVCFTSPNIGDTFTLQRIALEPTIQMSRVHYDNAVIQTSFSQKIIHWNAQRNEPQLQANQNVVVHKNNSAFIVTAQQTTSTPGALIKNVRLHPDIDYTFTATGYATSPNAFLIVYNGKHRLSPNYVVLPTTRGNVSIHFNPQKLRSVNIGICFTRPQIGNTFYIEEMLLDTTSSTKISNESSKKDDAIEEQQLEPPKSPVPSVHTSPQQIAQAKFVSWTYHQYASMICQSSHVELINDVAQCTLISSNGTPGVFIDIHVPVGVSIRFTLNGYTSYSDFRLVVYSPDHKKELISSRVLIGEMPREHFVEFKNIEDDCLWVGLICTTARKGATAFIKSMDVREVAFVDERFTNGSIPTIETPFQKSLALSVPRRRTSLEIMESPGVMESPGEDEEIQTKPPCSHDIQPRQIPEEIKNIELQIFSLVDSINNMNVNLTKTEQKLIDRIRKNTS